MIAGACTYGGTAASTLLFAGVGAGVLQALDVEVAAYVGNDLFALNRCSDEVGVFAGFDVEGTACGDEGVGIGGVGAVYVASGHAGVGGDA